MAACNDLAGFWMCPAYHRWLGAHPSSSPHVVSALLAAASPLSGLSPGTPAAGGDAAAGGASRPAAGPPAGATAAAGAGGFFRTPGLVRSTSSGHATPSCGGPGASARRAAALPAEVERALSWQSWAVDWEDQAVLAERHAAALLTVLRQAAGERGGLHTARSVLIVFCTPSS